MELTIKTQRENELLKRKEVLGEISFQGPTPSNQNLRDELAKKMGVSVDVVAVQHIYGAFGGINAKFDAHVYTSKEQLDKIEPKKKTAKTEAAAAPTKK